jgi:hypothetical protein
MFSTQATSARLDLFQYGGRAIFEAFCLSAFFTATVDMSQQPSMPSLLLQWSLHNACIMQKQQHHYWECCALLTKQASG